MSIEELRAAEVKAREAAVFAACQFGDTNKARQTHEMLALALDAYAAAVRATLEAEVEALVDAADEVVKARKWVGMRIEQERRAAVLENSLQPFLARRGR